MNGEWYDSGEVRAYSSRASSQSGPSSSGKTTRVSRIRRAPGVRVLLLPRRTSYRLSSQSMTVRGSSASFHCSSGAVA